MLTLYGLPPSGNVHKVRLALNAAGIRHHEAVAGAADRKAPAFLKLNALGQVPVLVDGDIVIADSQAILVYIAAKHRPDEWDGRDPVERGRIARWLSIAANEIAGGPASLRLAALFGSAIDRPAAEALTGRLLAFLDAHLAERMWLEGGRRTIADFACAPYLALAHQGGVDLAPYPNIRSWLRTVENAPGFVPMPGWGR